jgi:hypothetical protein
MTAAQKHGVFIVVLRKKCARRSFAEEETWTLQFGTER